MAERPDACAEWQDDLAAWLVAQGSPEREAALEAHLAVVRRVPGGGRQPVRGRRRVPRRRPDPGGGERARARRLTARRARRADRRRGSAASGAGGPVRRAVLVAAGGAAAAAVARGRQSWCCRRRRREPARGRRVRLRTVGDAARPWSRPTTAAGRWCSSWPAASSPTSTYALWLTPPGGTYDDRVPAGTFRAEDDGTVDVRLRSMLDPDDVGRVWATTPATRSSSTPRPSPPPS